MDNWNGIGSLFIASMELILIINLLVFADKNHLNKKAMLLITLLMIYQSLEFLMCRMGLASSFTAYLAFVDITFLPPLSLLLTLRFFNYNSYKLRWVFMPAILFVIYYSIVIPEFEVTACTVLYAAYNYPLGDLYGFFYYVPILISFILLLMKMKKESGKRKILNYLLITGHTAITLPVVVGFVLMFSGVPDLVNIMESVMCKFAFLFALALSIFCLVNSEKKNVRSNP
ncbi:MAG: hypothetical protein IPM56_01795 [Ignavibacteriales bacterium]|nr:MAG: hypothetical protein IPM56_01795 [Ignavibacteriales bacterium]